MKTSRLTIKFKGLEIGADIEQGVSLPDALRELAKTMRQIEAGDYEDIDEESYKPNKE